MTDHPIPRLGLGTFSRTGEEGLAAMLTALELGYRHLDTAQSYGTESVIGEALRRSDLPRNDIFITTKVADSNLAKERFLPSLRESLDRLGVDRIDLTLIHWPSYRDGVPFADYMGDLAEAKAAGMTRLIGVSNFTIPHLEKGIGLLSPGEIVTNQVEFHPYLQTPNLRNYCADNQIAITAYMPLAKGRVAEDPTLAEIAAKYGATASEIALTWLLQRGMIVIPASGKRAHLESNLRARSLSLTEQDMAAIDALDRNDRMINPAKAPAWDD